ncbi:hypothetical protein PAP_09810 [Palaeococcus pacificus DY20341]|uniref:DUF58 domain-containing protein n=1 Tax=Palaeococcus pacificus DY20341 TaxID=1343739 RepID=A0A075LWC4_9EURY|nr:DUF58 domain-containing protein [Palaeococcus pacificus]AIF70337.1 hypothetical protein PAP_09810 [Palaeococcus pacificus DY20341]
MKREDMLWTLIGLSFVHGYLASNPFSAVFGASLGGYLIYSRMTFKPKVEVERSVDENLEEGKKAKVTLKVKNLGSKVKIRVKENAPPWVQVEEPEPVLLSPEETAYIVYHIIPNKRGEYELSTKLEVYDPSELYFEEFDVGTYRLEVYPSVDSLREAAKEDYNIRIGQIYKKSMLLGLESMELYGLREYLPGDDLKKIDWKASARLGELIVKEFLKDSESDVYLVLDATREMRKGVKRAKIDYASTLALHMATLLLKRNYSVGMIVYTDEGFRIIPPSRGREQLNRVRLAVKFKPEKGLPSLKGNISKFSEKGKRFLRKLFPRKRRSFVEALLNIKNPSYLIVITDLMGHTSQLYRVIMMLKKKHKVIILSPNPILFYAEKLDENELKFLYKRYLEREKMLKRFNALVPTIDLGPSDYLREIVREIR